MENASMLTRIRVTLVVLLSASCLQVKAQNLVAYYQIGLNAEAWVKWDTYVVDASSIKAEGECIRYKSFRITPAGSDKPQELRADCKTKRRGLASDASMYSTYEGALTGEEVRVACEQARKLGVLAN
jgi:hypothetical protein